MGLLDNIWDVIVRLFKGKKVVVLGAKATGKTTFHKFIREGVLVSEYEETFRETVKGNTLRHSGFKLHIKKGEDIGGDDKFVHDYWQELVRDCDYCFYLFNAYDVYRGDDYQIDKLEEQLPFLAKLLQGNAAPTRLLVVGTFTDKIPEFAADPKRAVRKIRPNIINAIDDAKLDLNHVVYGSLASWDEANTLIGEIFQRIYQMR